MSAVPTLDFGPISCIELQNEEAWSEAARLDDTKKVLQDFDSAMRKFGFVQITDHGVSNTSLASLRESADAFFQKEDSEKMKLMSEHYGAPGGGFTPIGRESVGRTSDVSDNNDADPVENFVFANRGQEPNGTSMPGDFSRTAQEYWAETESLCLRLMRTSALALGLRFDFFDSFYAEPSCSLRLANYPPPQPSDAGKIRYGAHTDYTGFTILSQSQDGLEVLVADDTWVPVPPCARGGLVVNAGDLLPIWTAGRWKSAIHRVVFPKDCSSVTNAQSSTSRLSCVFFTGPHDDTLVEPVHTCCDGNEHSYPAVRAGDHLQSKLAASNV